MGLIKSIVKKGQKAGKFLFQGLVISLRVKPFRSHLFIL